MIDISIHSGSAEVCSKMRLKKSENFKKNQYFCSTVDHFKLDLNSERLSTNENFHRLVWWLVFPAAYGSAESFENCWTSKFFKRLSNNRLKQFLWTPSDLGNTFLWVLLEPDYKFMTNYSNQLVYLKQWLVCLCRVKFIHGILKMWICIVSFYTIITDLKMCNVANLFK